MNIEQIRARLQEKIAEKDAERGRPPTSSRTVASNASSTETESMPDWPTHFPTIIDSTMLTSFRACPQQFFRSYCQRLAPPGPDPDLHFGAAYACGLDTARKSYYSQGASPSSAISLGATAIAQAWGDYEPPPQRNGKPHVKQFDRCIEALLTYFDMWPLEDDNLQPLHTDLGIPSIEYSFASPTEVQHPETADPLLYGGRMDMIGSAAGIPCIVDDKTSSRLFSINWALRNQFLGYTHELQQHGLPVSLVLVRRMLIYTHECTPYQELVSINPHMISRYLQQRHRDLLRMTSMWHDYRARSALGEDDPEAYLAFDYNFGDSCSAYKGCPFQTLCTASDPTPHEAGFTENTWSPIQIEERL